MLAATHAESASPECALPVSERTTRALDRLGSWGLTLLPGVLLVFLSFNAGGFFPGTPALVAVVLLLLLVSRIILVPQPFAGVSPALAVAAGALTLYTSNSVCRRNGGAPAALHAGPQGAPRGSGPLGRDRSPMRVFRQSHLNRDFCEFAATTPTDFLARQVPGGGVIGDGISFVQDAAAAAR
jgi:hypothetical protein